MYLYLVRHGQSIWNAEGRHQGWQDVALSPLGEQQAGRIGERLKSQPFDYIFTSPIKRCYDTAATIVQAQGRPLDDLQVREGLKEARLSAELEGLSEKDISKRWTAEQKKAFREDYTFRFPDGESVKAVMERMIQEFGAIAALSEEAPPEPEEEKEGSAPADTQQAEKQEQAGEGQLTPDTSAALKSEQKGEGEGTVATGRDGEREKPQIIQKTALIVAHKINVQLFILYALDGLDAVARRQNNIDRLEIANCSLSVIETNLKGKQPYFRVLTVNDVSHLQGLNPPKPSAGEPTQ